MGGWIQDRLLPYSKDGTSKEAAVRMVSKADAQRQKILGYIARVGTATCDEIEQALQLPHQSVSARINELNYAFKAIERTGKRRETRSGRWADLYAIRKGEPQEPVLRKNWKDEARKLRNQRDELLIKAKRLLSHVRVIIAETETLGNTHVWGCSKDYKDMRARAEQLYAAIERVEKEAKE